MSRWYLLSLRVANIFVFFWILTIFYSIFDISFIELTAIINIVINLKEIISYAIFLLLYGIALVLSSVAVLLFSWYPLFSAQFMSVFLDTIFRNMLNSWFYFTDGPVESLGEIPGRLIDQLGFITDDLYFFSFQLLFLLVIYYFLRSVLQKDPKYNFRVVGYLIGLIIVPLFVIGLKDMLALFNLSIEYLDNLQNPLSSLILGFPSNDILAFILSPMSLLAVAMYIYLDLSFQINYVNLVSKPSLERSERLEDQLELLHKESLEITANIDQIKEESKKKKEELGIEGKEKISAFLAKKEQKFSYVKEMIQKKKLEEEEKKLLTAARDTRKLGSYLERLFREDPTAHGSLTAASSAPRPSRLILSTLLSFVIRVTALMFIGYIILHTAWLITNVLFLPEAISESVATFSPELIIIVMLPVLLLFPVSAQVISYVKKQALIRQLMGEEEIKQIEATVGDYLIAPAQEKEEEEKEEEKKEEGEVALT